jgi:hypothetical protein
MYARLYPVFQTVADCDRCIDGTAAELDRTDPEASDPAAWPPSDEVDGFTWELGPDRPEPEPFTPDPEDAAAWAERCQYDLDNHAWLIRPL